MGMGVKYVSRPKCNKVSSINYVKLLKAKGGYNVPWGSGGILS